MTLQARFNVLPLFLSAALPLGAPQKLDTDKKGFITAEDLSAFSTAHGKTLEVEFEDMIAACKPETEGRLTKPEFAKLFSAMFPDVGKKSRSKKGPGRR